MIMPPVKKAGGTGPASRSGLPDALFPDFNEMMRQLQEFPRSLIGLSYYYLRKDEDRISLCRILPSAGSIFFHEVVDHRNQGIAEDDLEDAIDTDTGRYSLAGYYPISAQIETKLRKYLGIA